jgi:DnaK suppressor protein
MSNRENSRADNRYQELRDILAQRSKAVAVEVQSKIRSVRMEATNTGKSRIADASESSEADIQDDIEFALLQMKAEILNKIGAALTRLDEGTYGYCYECGEEIAERRLRALPFAARCKGCEEAKETERTRERVIESRSKAVSLFGSPLAST